MIFTYPCNAIEDTQKISNRNGGVKWIKVHTQWGCRTNVHVHTREGGQILGALACIYYVNDPHGYAEGSGFYVTKE